MVSMFDCLCNDVKLIVYKVIHEAAYASVKREYCYTFGIDWNDGLQHFQGHYVAITYRDLCNSPLSEDYISYNVYELRGVRCRKYKLPNCYKFSNGSRYNDTCR